MIVRNLSCAVMCLLGCAADSAIEDPEGDEFLTEDAKADAFGVEDWSPDGWAVLKLASTASADKLRNDVGLSTRAVNGIIAERAELGRDFDDLAELDAASYIGKTAFAHMLAYVAEQGLFKTALRVPLVLADSDGIPRKLLTEYTTLAHAHGKPGFARYTFVDEDTSYSQKMGNYDTRLQELADAAGVTIDLEMFGLALTLDEFNLGSQPVCFIGKPSDVGEIPKAHYESMMGEFYSVWASRYQDEKWTWEPMSDAEEADRFGDAWTDWDTASKSVLVMSTSDEDSDFMHSEEVPPCR